MNRREFIIGGSLFGAKLLLGNSAAPRVEVVPEQPYSWLSKDTPGLIGIHHGHERYVTDQTRKSPVVNEAVREGLRYFYRNGTPAEHDIGTLAAALWDVSEKSLRKHTSNPSNDEKIYSWALTMSAIVGPFLDKDNYVAWGITGPDINLDDVENVEDTKAFMKAVPKTKELPKDQFDSEEDYLNRGIGYDRTIHTIQSMSFRILTELAMKHHLPGRTDNIVPVFDYLLQFPEKSYDQHTLASRLSTNLTLEVGLANEIKESGVYLLTFGSSILQYAKERAKGNTSAHFQGPLANGLFDTYVGYDLLSNIRGAHTADLLLAKGLLPENFQKAITFLRDTRDLPVNRLLEALPWDQP